MFSPSVVALDYISPTFVFAMLLSWKNLAIVKKKGETTCLLANDYVRMRDHSFGTLLSVDIIIDTKWILFFIDGSISSIKDLGLINSLIAEFNTNDTINKAIESFVIFIFWGIFISLSSSLHFQFSSVFDTNFFLSNRLLRGLDKSLAISFILHIFFYYPFATIQSSRSIFLVSSNPQFVTFCISRPLLLNLQLITPLLPPASSFFHFSGIFSFNEYSFSHE